MRIVAIHEQTIQLASEMPMRVQLKAWVDHMTAEAA
jgi:hypothetical protein